VTVTHWFSKELAGLLNEIVPRATGMGGYACGVVTVLAVNDRLEPDRELLEAAAACDGSRSDQIRQIYDAWSWGKKRSKSDPTFARSSPYKTASGRKRLKARKSR